jgi:hypothetical protein
VSLSVKAARASGQGGISRRSSVQGGGLLGAIGGFAKKALGVAVSTVTGGPLSGASSALRAVTGQGSRPAMGFANVPAPQQVPVPGIIGRVQRALPGGQTGMMSCPAGHRPNKSSYFLKDGTYVEKGSVCVRIRRRNPFNPRALDRAMSRLESAGRGAKRLGFTAPSPRKVAQAGARKGKRRRR